MNATLVQRVRQNPLLSLLCLALLLLPVTNSVGQIPLYLASLAWCVHSLRNKPLLHRQTLFFISLYALILLATLLYGARPGLTMEKMNRLLLFPLIFVVPSAIQCGGRSKENLRQLFLSAVCGAAIMAVYDMVRIPLEMRNGTPFFHTGNMTSPQLYMVALFLLLAVRAETQSPRRFFFLLLCLLCVAGLLMHNKRGVWLAAILVLPVWTLWSRQWKTLVFMGLIGLLALCLPTVRERLGQLQEVVNPQHGGRMVLWREVAPRLIPKYPYGMGYNASRHEDFREVLPREIHLEPGLKHLHSNPLQIRLETGWHGIIFWGCWMLSLLLNGFRKAPSGLRLLRGGAACAFLALLLNGLVEYNFGTSEIFMVYMILIGILTHFRTVSPEPERQTTPA